MFSVYVRNAFLKNSKPLWKHFFFQRDIFCFFGSNFYKVRTNSQTLIRNAPSLSDDIEFKKEQTKKMQNTERWKTRFSTVWGGNVGLY